MAGLLGRSWLAVLVVLGLVVGLLGAGVDRAQGQNDPMASNTTVYSACVGAAAESAGFEDTAGLGAESAIDCIRYYGITQGRTATVYAPTQAVSRWQMALFLARAAGPAGVVLADPASDQGFTDIGGLSEEAANAVNALAQAEIMPGRSDTTLFAPDDSVTRQEMAVLLDAFLGQAVLSDGSLGDEDGESQYPDDITALDEPFTDIDDVPLGAFNAIGRIYEIGVTLGRTATTFVPDGLVTRGEMAQFISRMLAHTIARPAGVSIQVSQSSILGAPDREGTVTAVVAVRDTNFRPVVDAFVDVIVVADSDIEMAFTDAGTCDIDADISSPEDERNLCELTDGDSQVDETGEDTIDITVPGENVTVWAWTGDEGDVFDRDTTVAAQANIGFSNAATKVLITDNLADGQTKLKYGETWRVTLQLADDDNNPVAEAGREIQVRTIEDTDRRASSTAETSRTRTETTDANGQVALSFTQTDPDRDESASEDTFVSVAVVIPGDGLDAVEDMSGGGILCISDSDVGDGTDNATECRAEWSDDAAVATTLRLEQPRDYTDRSVRDANIRVTATLTDQYGDPAVGVIFFDAASVTDATTVDDVDYSGNPVDLRSNGRVASRGTNSIGQATYVVPAPSADRAVDTITAETRGPVVNDATPDTDLLSVQISHYWVVELGATDSMAGSDIVVLDKDRNQIVFDNGTNEFRIVEYDSNDQFNIGDGTANMAQFEEDLGTDDTITVVGYSQDADGVSTFTLINGASS